MAIFSEDDGAVGFLIETCQLARSGIVGSIDVRHLREIVVEVAEVAANLRIAYGATWVKLCLYIVAQAQADVGKRILVAKAPDEHRGVVFVAAYGGLRTLLQHWIELVLRQVLVAIAEGHLVDDIEAE